MFVSKQEVTDWFEYILENKKKITYQGDHILYAGGDSYSRLTRTLAGGRKVQLYAHQLAALYKNRDTVLDPNKQCSHLCHIRGCINPEHIVQEHQSINMNRTACVHERKVRNDSKFCFGHQGHPDCI